MALAEFRRKCCYDLRLRGVMLVVVAVLASAQAFAANNCGSVPSRPSVALDAQTPTGPRALRVVLYPFLPNFAAYRDWVVNQFKSLHPDIQLKIVDLSNNYYGSFTDDYVGRASADVYELDSVFLNDFALNKKIQPLHIYCRPRRASIRGQTCFQKRTSIHHGRRLSRTPLFLLTLG
jgi:ABC-type glycerol-3-phosphate transport system substrate-binding protein